MVVYYKVAGQSIGSHWVRFTTISSGTGSLGNSGRMMEQQC